MATRAGWGPGYLEIRRADNDRFVRDDLLFGTPDPILWYIRVTRCDDRVLSVDLIVQRV
ncbi:MAG: hypothetical protein IPJ06_04725 [Saprospiraceae bacterium]|nr:hypothetical protein [Saprospiraceae bacterium]